MRARVLDFDGVPDPLDGKIGEVIDNEPSGVTLNIDGNVYRFAQNEVEILEDQD